MLIGIISKKLMGWKSWDSLEKASFVAQCATTISFVTASGFSYLSWQEARLAREEQRQYFSEEKPPEMSVKLLDVLEFDGTKSLIVRLLMKNEGNSTAYKVDASLLPVKAIEDPLSIDPMSRLAVERTFERNREKEILVAIIRPIPDYSKWDFSTARLHKGGRNRDYNFFATLQISYHSHFGKIYSDDYYVEAKFRKK